jgi:lysozyme
MGRAAMTPNLAAFLMMISHSEGTDRAPDPYRCCYAYRHTIVNLSDHPAITGEWAGESLSALGPRYAHSISTAAGRYQINKPSWLEGQRTLHLPDFTGPSQDAWCVWCFKTKGAYELINSGNVAPAIGRLRETWASLPGGSSGQPQRSLASLVDVYSTAGGTVA